MPELRHGKIVVSIPDHIVIPDLAGTLSDDDVRQIPKARLGLGQACADAADDWRDIPSFVVPGVNPDDLRRKGKMAEDIDGVITSFEVLLGKLKQANLLIDADAWEDLRKVNDQVKVQGKHEPLVPRIFRRLIEFMSVSRAVTPPSAG